MTKPRSNYTIRVDKAVPVTFLPLKLGKLLSIPRFPYLRH